MVCTLPYSRSWCVATRDDAIRRLLDAYKFERALGGAQTIASLLDHVIDRDLSQVIIVPVPTATPHVRQRGYDHTHEIAARLASSRGALLQQPLRRNHNKRQLGAPRTQRIAQAAAAFTVRGQIDESAIYLVIDDIVTTGATIRYSAEALRQAGATEVWCAAVAVQPLDKQR